MKRPRPTRLARWHEYALYALVGALAVSGLMWLAFEWWVRVEGDFGPEHHPAQRLTLILHGIAAYAFLVIGGALIPVHVKVGWTMRRNRGSGLSLAIAALIAGATALVLYYAGEERLRSGASLVHWILGLVLVPMLAFHALRGRSRT